MTYSKGSVKVKVKESRNRPGVAQRVPGGLGSQISWHSAREGGEVVRLTHRPPLPPGMFLVLIFTRGWLDPRALVRSKGNMSLKNPVIPPEIDPGTVRLVAQRLNHYAIPGPTKVQNNHQNHKKPPALNVNQVKIISLTKIHFKHCMKIGSSKCPLISELP